VSIGLQGAFQDRSSVFNRFNGQYSIFDSSSNDDNVSINQPIFQSPNESSDQDNQPFETDEPPRSSNKSGFGSITANITIGGRPLTALSDANDNSTEGTIASVTGGNITLKNDSEDTLTVESQEQLTFQRQENGSIKVFNQASDKSITVEAGKGLQTSGEGRINLFGEFEQLSINAGQSLTFNDEGDETFAVKPASKEKLTLSSGENILSVSSGRPNQTDSLTLLSSDGTTISFEEGETGTIEKNDDGTLTITNEDQSRSVTLEADTSLDLLGEAEARVVNGESIENINIHKGQDLQLSSGEDGQVTLSNESSLERLPIDSGEADDPKNGRLQVQFFENPVSLANQFITERLVQTRSNETGRSINRSENNSSKNRIDNPNSQSRPEGGTLNSNDTDNNTSQAPEGFDPNDQEVFGFPSMVNPIGQDNDTAQTSRPSIFGTLNQQTLNNRFSPFQDSMMTSRFNWFA
jgi:hypothetical protein